jgi:hypothetical protein
MIDIFKTTIVLVLALSTIASSSTRVCGPDEKATADILFLIDTSPSMCQYTAAVSEGMKKFVKQIEASGIDAQYAVASFGGEPRVLQAFTVCLSFL